MICRYVQIRSSRAQSRDSVEATLKFTPRDPSTSLATLGMTGFALPRANPPKTICRLGPVFLPAACCNRSRNMPKLPFHFHADNFGAHAHPLLITARNISPNRDAPPPGADRKNMFPPNAPRPWHRGAPFAYRVSTRRLRSTRAQVCRGQLPPPDHVHTRV